MKSLFKISNPAKRLQIIIMKRLKSSLLFKRIWALFPPIPTPTACGPKNSIGAAVRSVAPVAVASAIVVVNDFSGRLVDSKNLQCCYPRGSLSSGSASLLSMQL